MLLMPDNRLAFFMAGCHYYMTLKNAGAFLCRRRTRLLSSIDDIGFNHAIYPYWFGFFRYNKDFDR
ncbi:hypothetical protein DDT52_07270 [Brenneria roseae subsp. roseae]|uniref:hypothetical protein n=1 Tax=Brenneria roseae TaxID=1509241 RepID=UPI000D60EA98|nr:hypothetical protein [Brenneria roseae]PWC21319.1 hypothetical protein DDT52_07270 [Brenneria roseae subsp. roseae]